MLTPVPSGPRQSPGASQRQSRHVRRDIQGLRAVAVILVILNHLLGKPAGGFVGVDIFFVVSGFVITGLLLREATTAGRISLRGFYLRRVKRIAPAAVSVLLATVFVGSLLLSGPREEQLKGDALWAALFGANWHFVFLGTDYMHATDAVSPVQHFWSLSVEEQFYAAWPLIAVVSLLIARTRIRAVLACAASVIILISLACSFRETLSTPTMAYFSTESRAWELAVGSLLACLAPLWRRLPSPAQTPLAWAGLTLIAGAVLSLNAGSAFPAPGALLPVVGTAAILVAGERGPTPDLYPLTNRATDYIGDISYSLYVWHFPVIVFVGILHPQLGHAYLGFSVLLIAGLAVLSYHLVEKPLRNARWLRRPQQPSNTAAKHWYRAAPAAVFVITFAVLIGTFVTRSPMQAAANPLPSLALPSDARSLQLQRMAAVDAGVHATTWPRLTPGIANLEQARAPEWIKDGCLGDDYATKTDPYANALHCVFGNPNGKHTIVLLGDSTAISYLPGIRRALDNSWRIEAYTLQQCPAIDIDVVLGGGAPHPDCTTFRPRVLAHLRKVRPDRIILTSSSDSFYRLASRATGDSAVKEWAADTRTTLTSLSKVTKKVVILDPPPSMGYVTNCYTPISAPSQCVTPVEPAAFSMLSAQSTGAAGIARVVYPSTLTWFCSREGLCPAIVGTVPQTVDGRHLTDREARQLAPLIREAVLAQ